MKLLSNDNLQAEPGRAPLEPSQALENLIRALGFEALQEKYPEGLHLPTLMEHDQERLHGTAFVLSAEVVPDVYDASGRPQYDERGTILIHKVRLEDQDQAPSSIIKPGPQVVN